MKKLFTIIDELEPTLPDEVSNLIKEALNKSVAPETKYEMIRWGEYCYLEHEAKIGWRSELLKIVEINRTQDSYKVVLWNQFRKSFITIPGKFWEHSGTYYENQLLWLLKLPIIYQINEYQSYLKQNQLNLW